MKLIDMLQERAELSASSKEIVTNCHSGNRIMSTGETVFYEHQEARIKALDDKIGEIEAKNTMSRFDPRLLMTGAAVERGAPSGFSGATLAPVEHPQASAVKARFGSWMRRAVGNLSGLSGADGDASYYEAGRMEAASPGGVISIGTGSGLDSVNFAVPTQILPFMRSYIQYSPFERVGASVISTDHMRTISLPVVSAGAPPSAYSEGAGPASGASGSTPFGMCGFTMAANKVSRQVIADWESLQSTEFPMTPMIVDELLASVANVMTATATTAMYNALTAPPGVTVSGLAPLQIGGAGVTADVYGQLTALRHALVDGLEDPTNAFMLSRSSLAVIRNSRASTSGVPLFDPESDTVLGRPYVTNEYFDTICGTGFVAYGNWNKGAWLRRTPVITKVLDQLYALNNEVGFLATQWGDNHFLAELIGAANPPTHQPLYFTTLSSGLLA